MPETKATEYQPAMRADVAFVLDFADRIRNMHFPRVGSDEAHHECVMACKLLEDAADGLVQWTEKYKEVTS